MANKVHAVAVEGTYIVTSDVKEAGSMLFSERKNGLASELKQPEQSDALQDNSQPFQFGNPWQADQALQDIVRRFVPEEVFRRIEPNLDHLGKRCASDILAMHWDAAANNPKIQHFDASGKRVDELVASAGWRSLKGVAAQEGLVAAAYEREHEEYSRVDWAARMLLFGPNSAYYHCPLAMTDACATVILGCGDRWLQERALPHLLSKDPEQFWTSGQWMTEINGGSDVSGATETYAVPIGNVSETQGMTHLLYGAKWFSSAADSNVALTLAREHNVDGNPIPGNQGLACFYVELRDSAGKRNGISIDRLKDKMGTKQLPTAEIKLDGVRARKVSPTGQGIQTIVQMVNISRIYTAIFAVGHQRRMLQLARDFASRRKVFGKLLVNQSLHVHTLANMEVESRGCMQFVLEAARLLGRKEAGASTEDDELLLRLLTPIVKLYTSKQSTAITSEGIEAFGGLGYVEDSGLPEILRDSYVNVIWEGTTNVLSLDVMRVLQKFPEKAMEVYSAAVAANLRKGASALKQELKPTINKVETNLQELLMLSKSVIQNRAYSKAFTEIHARQFSYSIARVYIAGLLCAHAAFYQMDEDAVVFKRWVQKGLIDLELQEADACEWDLVIGGSTKLLEDSQPFGPSYVSKL